MEYAPTPFDSSAITSAAPLRVLITRPKQDALPLAETLKAQGHQVLVNSMMTIQYRRAAKQELNRLLGMKVQAMLITSANGVRALSKLTHRRDIPIITIGDASKHIARNYGFQNIMCATDDEPGITRTDVVNLTRYVKNKCSTARGVLVHIAGSVTAGDLEHILTNAGFVIKRIVLYNAQPMHRLEEEVVLALKEHRLDVAMFYSPRTARIFLELLHKADALDSLPEITAVCLSENVKKMLLEQSGDRVWKAIHVAETPKNDAMMLLLNKITPRVRYE